MSRVIRITGALTAAVLAAAPGAFAQVTSRGDTATMPRTFPGRYPASDTGASTAQADSTYVRQAIRANALEVALGRLGDDRADDDGVEEFAKRMVSDHNSMNDQWGKLAEKQGVKIGVQDLRAAAGDPAIERLQDLSGAAFDQAYMSEMIRRQEQDLAAFQRIGTSASSPDVRELANSGVSTMREHLTLAREVGSRVGVSTTATRDTFASPTPSADDDRRRTPADRAARDEAEDRDDRDVRGNLRREDRAFIQNVLQNHLMHLQLAERAKREVRSNEVRRLAERIEDDYKQWQERWEQLAERYDVKAPKRLGPLHQQKVDRLERASKKNVDRTYVAIVVENLESVVPYFRKEGQAVRPDEARGLVNGELPIVREYLARARRLQQDSNARAEASERE